MRIVVFLAILFSMHISIAQQINVSQLIDQKELTEIENAVKLYWKWDTDEDPKNAVIQLDNITKKYTGNWLAPYWASYISTQIANSLKLPEYLDKARDYYNTANNRLLNAEPNDTLLSYFKGLNSLIYSLKSFNTADTEKIKELQDSALKELNEGIRLKADNPVLWVLAATSSTLDFRNNFGNRLTGMALLRMAKKEFEKLKDRSSADITYWNEHWINTWLTRLTPKAMQKNQ